MCGSGECVDEGSKCDGRSLIVGTNQMKTDCCKLAQSELLYMKLLLETSCS